MLEGQEAGKGFCNLEIQALLQSRHTFDKLLQSSLQSSQLAEIAQTPLYERLWEQQLVAPQFLRQLRGLCLPLQGQFAHATSQKSLL